MNKDVLEGKWKQIRGEAKAWWGKLTDDDLERAAGEVRPRGAGRRVEPEMTSETTGLEIDTGEDQQAGHARRRSATRRCLGRLP